MAELKPAYLIHGDDHGAVAERRAGLRALAEAPGADATVELLEGDAATPDGVTEALAAMTLAIGRRVIVVEGVERWRQADVEKTLAAAIGQMPPDTTLALFAREEARAKAPDALHEAVRSAGGQVVAQMTVKPWELPKWAREQASRIGLSLDAAAAKAIVAQVGERQQRLLRELEKLALEGDADETAGVTIDAQRIDDRAAHSAEWRAYALADALVGSNAREATLSYLRLREQGERLSGLIYLMSQRLRDALAVALRLQAGESEAVVKRTLRMPSRAADRFIADVARSDPSRLRGALAALADLELDSRGGAVIASERTPLAALGEDTLALRAIHEIAA
ncbi:MAG TPA: DNA polymerase III subunit delta [Solirubrobacteraceae bacterium]|nr:DNA polymerase III subunit delta [Solirubrobacteraceae bacterium]